MKKKKWETDIRAAEERTKAQIPSHERNFLGVGIIEIQDDNKYRTSACGPFRDEIRRPQIRLYKNLFPRLFLPLRSRSLFQLPFSANLKVLTPIFRWMPERVKAPDTPRLFLLLCATYLASQAKFSRKLAQTGPDFYMTWLENRSLNKSLL